MAQTDLIFDKYELVKRIAIGGMGEIFLARQNDTLIDRFVILKSMLPDLAADQTWVDQFLGEARVAATLNHPNIVSIYEVGAWHGVYYIAMEYIDGSDLAQLISAARQAGILIAPVVAARIALDAASALEHAALAKDLEGRPLRIVHRDISPHNIMLRRDGVVKVVDFGIARSANLVSRTLTGQVKGKLSYMPPEQLLGTTLDWRADQFALAVVLWELCTCDRLIKPGTSHLELIETTTKENMEDPCKVEPSVPQELGRIILKMGSRKVDDRYSTWAEVRADLEAFIREIGAANSELTVQALQEKLLGEELKNKAEQTTSGVPNNFLINLQGSGTVPVGPIKPPAVPDPDEVATVAKQDENTPAVSARGVSVQGVGVLASESKLRWFALICLIAMVTFGVVRLLIPQTTTPATQAVTSAVPANQPTTAPIPLAIRVEGPKGAAVSLNGQKISEQAPLTLDNLAHGEHDLVLSVTGYPPIEQTLVLDGSQNPLVVNPALPPAIGTLLLKSRPAKVGIYRGQTLIGTTGSPLSLSANKTHHLALRKPGFKPYALSLVPRPGQTIEQAVVLKREISHKTKPPKASSNREPPAPITKTVVVAQELGSITLNTTPWTNVFIDERAYGPTPIFKRPLKAGTHTIRMVHQSPDEGISIDETREVLIRAGQTRKLNWELTP